MLVRGACLLAESRYPRGMKAHPLACAFLLLAIAGQLPANILPPRRGNDYHSVATNQPGVMNLKWNMNLRL